MTAIIQRQLGNGTWIEEDDPARFIDMVLNRTTMTTADEVMAVLESGKELKWDNDWYACIRMKPEAKAPKAKDYPTGRMVDCGCFVYMKNDVMTTSTGNSCPNCYDRMSD